MSGKDGLPVHFQKRESPQEYTLGKNTGKRNKEGHNKEEERGKKEYGEYINMVGDLVIVAEKILRRGISYLP